MKRLFILLLSFGVGSTLYAQRYTKVHDNPDETIRGYLAAEYFGIDWGSKNMKGTMFYTVGLNGMYPLTDNILAEAFLRAPLLRASTTSTGLIFEGGGIMTLRSNTNEKQVRILLGYKEEEFADVRTATVKYVTMPVNVKNSLIVRGGLYLKTTPFEYDSGNDLESFKPTPLVHKGVYAGIGRRKEFFTKLQTAGRNGAQEFGAGSSVMTYADLMLLPTSVDAELETFGAGGGGKTELKGLLGARVGLRWIRNPFTRAQNSGRKIPFFGNSVVGLELGYRPLEGIYFGSTISYMFKKFN